MTDADILTQMKERERAFQVSGPLFNSQLHFEQYSTIHQTIMTNLNNEVRSQQKPMPITLPTSILTYNGHNKWSQCYHLNHSLNETRADYSQKNKVMRSLMVFTDIGSNDVHLKSQEKNSTENIDYTKPKLKYKSITKKIHSSEEFLRKLQSPQRNQSQHSKKVQLPILRPQSVQRIFPQ
ncbi:hypothetical protein SS50377_26752 [Spironucleus salmonicida]|uniref:Uncharacterized protein n=1 Tax=Spironucleus salmonicida TaxID=348837 RepID=V6LZQ0_9EUKA|nr:hypothetical protein SS50377_26752 [Spironucleus salmonicida]|eukprot:EST49221.1 Hypothetical protein SS50377_10440 [Spironucleus salmonicida]